MARRAMSWFGVVALCAVFGGCKSHDDAAPISQDELPGAVASLECDSLGSCCSVASFAFDSTNCHAAETAQLKAELTDMLTPAVRYDAQAAGDCLAELKGRTTCGSTSPADDIAACDRIFTGTLAAGQACTMSAECASPAYCNRDGTTEQGVCTALAVSAAVRGKLGDNCSMTCDDATSCDTVVSADQSAAQVACYRSDSLYCDLTCQKLKAIGETCEASDICQKGLFCDFDSRICTAPHPNGAVCSGGYQCQSHKCSVDPVTGADGTCSSTSVTAEQCASGTP
jgi:hypothetical protein